MTAAARRCAETMTTIASKRKALAIQNTWNTSCPKIKIAATPPQMNTSNLSCGW